MNLDVLLRSSAANKHRRVSAADVVCCLEVPNKLLHYWLKSKEKNIVASIKNRGIKTDEMSRTVKPVLADISGPRTLEDRVQTRGRMLQSMLSQATRKKKMSILKKSILIDVKQQDTVSADSLVQDISYLSQSVDVARLVTYIILPKH